MSNIFEMQNLIARIVAKYEKFHNTVVEEFGVNGIYILALFVLFIALLIVIYAKAVIETFRKSEVSSQEDEQDGLFYAYIQPLLLEAPKNYSNSSWQEQPAQYIAEPEDDSDEQLSLEEQLSKSLVEVSAVSDDILNLQKEYAKLKQKMQLHAKQNKKVLSTLKTNYAQYLNSFVLKQPPKLKLNPEQQRKKDIHDLVCMILNLLGRSVSSRKTAQAVFFYNQETYSEQDIIQLIQTIRDFIGLCTAGHFDMLPNKDNLPSNKEAIYAWAHGETTPCLTLLQSYLNLLMSQSSTEEGIVKDMTYAQAANCACIMGNIARLTDKDLAHNSFELAIELSPNSTNAWSSLADMYIAEQNKERAMIAYQTVLDLGDDVMYSWQLANAYSNMADFYDNLGVETKAQDLRNRCYNFYKNYGIRVPLTAAERAAFELISNKKDSQLDISLEILLNTTGAFAQ